MTKSRKGNLRVVAWPLLGLAVWTLFVILVFESWSNDRPSSLQDTRPVHASPDTIDVPPIITMQDLRDLEFPDSLLRRIQPDFYVLNSALVTLVTLHQQFDTAQSAANRHGIEERAGVFHITADIHEETIEAFPTPAAGPLPLVHAEQGSRRGAAQRRALASARRWGSPVAVSSPARARFYSPPRHT